MNTISINEVIIRSELYNQGSVNIRLNLLPSILSDKNPMRKNSHLKNKITFLIGKNGVGKTSLLVDLADFFRIGSSKNRFDRKKSISLEFISYRFNGELISGYLNNLPFRYLDDDKANQGRRKPPMVIVVAMTPYDPYRTNTAAKYGNENYLYIGHKRGNSASSPIYNILERIVSSPDRFTKIRHSATRLLHFLEFENKFVLRYKWTIRANELQSITDVIRMTEEDDANNIRRLFSNRPGESGPVSPIFIWEKIQAIRNDFELQSRNRYLQIPIDFSMPHTVESQRLEDIQLLRQYGLLSLLEIRVSKTNGQHFNLQGSSSGELSMMTSLLGILSGVEDGSLILIDEPEVSLHPDWQSKYAGILEAVLRDFTGTHIIIATHSPLIISGGQEYNATIVSLEPDRLQRENPLGHYDESSDFILLEKFGTLTDDNLYLRELILEAIRLTGRGEFNSERYKSILRMLRRVQDKMDSSAKMYQVITDLLRAHPSVEGS